MFVSYNLAGVELSQTHCVLHTCAVFSPCFSQGFPLLFIYIFVLTALGLHCCTFSAAVSGGCSLWGVCGLLIGVASLVEGMGSRMCGLQWLWHMGLVAWRHVGSSWTRDRMHVSCTGRKILNHWPPGMSMLLLSIPEMPGYRFFFFFGILEIFLCSLDTHFLQPALCKKTVSHPATLWIFPWLSRKIMD